MFEPEDCASRLQHLCIGNIQSLGRILQQQLQLKVGESPVCVDGIDSTGVRIFTTSFT
jgi:hypothetical protein